MATVLDSLNTARAAAAEKLAQVLADGAHHPTYSVDGESWSWTEYADMLERKIEKLKRLIQDETPFIISSRGIT